MPERLAELYAWERELREALEEGGPDSPNRAIWINARRTALADIQAARQEYSAAQPLPLTHRSAA
ncbi:hypothetical protein [Deinococcus sp. 6GRE01]|uniref:hypothetical protein n=1 Tax=Deinococcus sp. 6GRE01 TaxID=2745873 RepID=UPI001E510B3C|nr:hypothetical protein [Deinococcus sp. 6GRE01]MCD0155980.1 hypothetical protein [Deinococcus sp. 6GRE01]